MGHPLRSTYDHGPAASERIADLTPTDDAGKFEQLPHRKASATHGTSPDDVLTERAVGARPNLENSTACQKSMPINLVP